MAPITSKQWRALLQAFPVYGIDPSSRERRQEFITEGGAERVGQAFLLPLEATADGDVPLNLDQWLRGVFGLAPLTKKKKKDTTSLSNIPSLTENERVLLSLWWRERQRVDQYYSMYDELRERVESMRQQPSPSRLGESSTMVDGSRVFVSAIAHLPVANNTPGTTLGAAEPIRCEVCQDADGELYQCASCRSIRHEACGGPHPDEALSRNPTGTPQSDGPAHRMLCVDCRRTLNCDSSSSSLRSSTSSDERAELAALYGEDDDEDTSLSGFIAEDEEDEEEDEEGLDSAASSRSGPFTSRHLSERQPLYEPHSDEDEEMLLRGDGARRPQHAKASPPAAAVRSSATPRTKNKVKRPRDYSCSSSESSS